MVKNFSAESIADIVAAVQESKTLNVSSQGTGEIWRNPGALTESNLQIAYRGIIEHDVSDQVVVVRAGTPLAELQAALAEQGQCIPVGSQSGSEANELLSTSGSIGGQVSLNLPHGLEGACGNWRDWVLGLTLVRSDGEIAKCGSKAVKSVAGYDLAKLIVGSRGTLAIIAEVILRTYPLRALEQTEIEQFKKWPDSGLMQRCLPSEYQKAKQVSGDRLVRCNSQASTLYLSAKTRSEIHRHDSDWLLGWGLGSENAVVEDATQYRLMQTAKKCIDKALKLNPDEFSTNMCGGAHNQE